MVPIPQSPTQEGACKRRAQHDCPHLMYLWDCFVMQFVLETIRHHSLGKVQKPGSLIGAACSQIVPSGNP